MDEERPPSDPRAEALEHLKLANAYREKDDVDTALFECEWATRLAPNWADAHYLRGLLLESLGRSEEAEEAFQKAASLDPSYQDLPSVAMPPPVYSGGEPQAFEQTLDEGEYIPWTGRDTWWSLAMGLGLSIVVPLVLGTLMGAFSSDIDTFLSVLVPVGTLLWLLPVWWFAVRKYGVGLAAFGFRGFTGNTFAIGCGMVIGFYLVTALYAAILFGLLGLEMQPSLVPIAEELSVPWLLPLSAVMIAPIAEEVFFRGFLFAGFRRRYGWLKGAIISSALFALIHLQPLAFPPLFLLGFGFAFLYHRSNSIWLPISMHALVNLWGVIAQFIVGIE